MILFTKFRFNAINILSIFLICLILSSCSNPLSKKYNKDSFEEDAKAIRESNKLTEEDAELLAQYILLAKVAGTNLEDKTYEELLVLSKNLKQQNSIKFDQETAVEKEVKERIDSVLTVTIIKKKLSADNKTILYTLVFQNKTVKPIKSITGTFIINDLYDALIKSIDLKMKDPVGPRMRIEKSFGFPYLAGDEHDKQIAGAILIDLKLYWQPKQLVFNDGSVIQ